MGPSSFPPRVVGAGRYDPGHTTWGKIMRRRTAIVSTTALAIAGAATGLGIWLSQPSYDDVVKGCEKALTAQAKAGGTGKPGACKGVKSDDYAAIAASVAMGHLGWLDGNGNFDENKMLDSETP